MSQRRRVALGLVFIAAGCSTDDTVRDSEDAGTIAPPSPADAVIVQQVSMPVVTGTSTSALLAPTSAGSMLVVIAELSGASYPNVAEIAAAEQQFSRDRTSILTHVCGRGIEVWSLRSVAAGIEEVVVTTVGPMTARVHVLEVAGLSRFPLVDSQNINGSTPAPPPFVNAEPGYFTLSTIVTCGTITGLDPTSGFVRLETGDGFGIAHHVPSVSGPEAADWTFDGTYSNVIDVYR